MLPQAKEHLESLVAGRGHTQGTTGVSSDQMMKWEKKDVNPLKSSSRPKLLHKMAWRRQCLPKQQPSVAPRIW